LGNKAQFSFELSWIKQEGFYDMIAHEWASVTKGADPMEKWQYKIRHLRNFLRGWAKNNSGIYRKERDLLLSTIEALELKAESLPLSDVEREHLRSANDKVARLRRDEESKWAQRAKVKHVQEGGANTKYFHLIANGKHRRKKIYQLEQDEGIVVGQENLKHFITNYYKKLFGPPINNSFTLVESETSDVPQISEEENAILTAPFTEKEVYDALMQMDRNKAPGPDGFPAEFYQTMWGCLKEDFLNMFHSFFIGELPLFHLNFGTIILLPKKENAIQIQQYRPICLLNVSFKLFTKVATNRVSAVAEKVIRPTQSAFMPGRHILEGVLVLHETIHELQRKKMDGVLLKIDFEKAYDKVQWPFLHQVLRMKGFSSTWCSWIKEFITKGSVGIKVNDDIGHYFQTRKGLRQGDPLSPILFNLVADMLAILITRAKDDGRVEGLIPHLVDGGVSILQYADDTILFMAHDLEKAMNMKLILCIFEQLSGLKINFHKSEVFCFGRAKECEADYINLFGCAAGEFPFRYLGIPIHFRKLKNGEWKPVEDRFEIKLAGWIGKLLSYGDRLVLINSVLTSLPMFLLSFFEIPIGVRKRLDFFRSRFFWQSDGSKRKYRLSKWDIMCRPKDQGGLGIEVLVLKNKCLLSKWLFKILNEEGMWQELVQNKYLHSLSLSQVKVGSQDSPFWKGILRVRDDFFSRGHFVLGNGRMIRFWEDTWLGDAPLASQYPSLFCIVQRKNVLVADVMFSMPLNIAFRRSLVGSRWTDWLSLVSRLIQVQLTDQQDSFVWNLTQSGTFTVRSMYLDMINDGTKFLRKYIWKMKVPLKIKIFMWFLFKRVLLTKDNLAKRNWSGSKCCCFCNEDETINHLFISCPFAKIVWRIIHLTFNISPPMDITNLFGNWLAGIPKKFKTQIRVGACAILWTIWNTRNDIIFNNAKNCSFMQVIKMATHWIRMWSYLQHTEQRQALDTGCSLLEMVATDIYSQCSWCSDRRLTY
jgi:hypothetical protein